MKTMKREPADCQAIGQDSFETSSDLLRRFAKRHDQDAFEALMRRHGPLVWSACVRILGSRQDAEDAFQATFLLLVQKCRTIKRPELLGSWLYGVAYRIAARMRRRAIKRGNLSMQATDVATDDNSLDLARRELQVVLDEEVARLPEKYRLPVILCYLEGKTNAQAADQLGCPLGSMSSRLAKARELLRKRLARRGLSLTARMFALLIAKQVASPDVPLNLVSSTAQAAVLTASGKACVADVVSHTVARLIEEAQRQALHGRLRQLAVILLVMLSAAVITCKVADAIEQHAAAQRDYGTSQIRLADGGDSFFALPLSWLSNNNRAETASSCGATGGP